MKLWILTINDGEFLAVFTAERLALEAQDACACRTDVQDVEADLPLPDFARKVPMKPASRSKWLVAVSGGVGRWSVVAVPLADDRPGEPMTFDPAKREMRVTVFGADICEAETKAIEIFAAQVETIRVGGIS